MKTTIELADDLLVLAKQRALEQGTTLRALIESGLRSTLARPPGTGGPAEPYRFPVIRGALGAVSGAEPDVNALIDAIREEHFQQLTSQTRS